MQKYNYNDDEILKLNKEGYNLKQIGEILNIPAKMLSYYCIRHQLPIKKYFTYSTKDDFFDEMDSEIKFYLLGFFIADGCILYEDKKRNGVVYSHSCRLMLNNSTDDEEILQLFRDYICPTKPLEYSNCQLGVKYKRKPQCRFRWSSKHMFETLQSYGIQCRKTYNSNFKLPDEIVNSPLFFHLIRGLVDGDGYIGNNAIQICLNSSNFAKQIITFFENNFSNMTQYRCKKYSGKTCDWWVLYINGGKKLVREYYQKMYQNANFYLKRKYHNTEINNQIA